MNFLTNLDYITRFFFIFFLKKPPKKRWGVRRDPYLSNISEKSGRYKEGDMSQDLRKIMKYKRK